MQDSFHLNDQICLIKDDQLHQAGNQETIVRQTGWFMRNLSETFPSCSIVDSGKLGTLSEN